MRLMVLITPLLSLINPWQSVSAAMPPRKLLVCLIALSNHGGLVKVLQWPYQPSMLQETIWLDDNTCTPQ
jgi:hypothetical protein